jgi:mono/diheme cytochrome c family protein
VAGVLVVAAVFDLAAVEIVLRVVIVWRWFACPDGRWSLHTPSVHLPPEGKVKTSQYLLQCVVVHGSSHHPPPRCPLRHLDQRSCSGTVGRATAAAAVAATLGIVVAACGANGSAGDVADLDGAALSADNCASCHGADLRGSDEGPSQLSVVYEPSHHGDESYRKAIRFGAAPHHWNFGTMPPNDELDDAQIDAIIAFIRAEQERLGFEPYPP